MFSSDCIAPSQPPALSGAGRRRPLQQQTDVENFNGPALLWRQLLRSRGQFRVAGDRLPPPVAGPGPRQPQQQQPAVGAFNAPAPLQGQLLQSWVQYHHTTSPMWCPVGQLWPWCWLLRAAAGNGHGNRNRHPHPHAHASRNTTVIGYSLYVGVGYLRLYEQT